MLRELFKPSHHEVAASSSRRAAGKVILVALASALNPARSASTLAQEVGSQRKVGVILIGFSAESPEAQAFRQGLKEAGYLEGRDVRLEWRVADGDYERVPGFAAELVRLGVQVIVVDSTVATKAARQATSTVPIVMASVADPVGSGLVTSLSHPEGNITGLSLMSPEVTAKRLELLKEALPRLSRVAVLWNPGTPFHHSLTKHIAAVAPSLGVEPVMVTMPAAEEFAAGFARIVKAKAHAIYVLEDPLFFSHRLALLKLAAQSRLPGVYGERAVVEAGGFMSYGPNFRDLLRRSAGYVDRILKGAKPGDLPIEQPAKFDLVINLNTARALGVTVPQALLLRADEVIGARRSAGEDPAAGNRV